MQERTPACVHLWERLPGRSRWRCLLCGGTAAVPQLSTFAPIPMRAYQRRAPRWKRGCTGAAGPAHACPPRRRRMRRRTPMMDERVKRTPGGSDGYHAANAILAAMGDAPAEIPDSGGDPQNAHMREMVLAPLSKAILRCTRAVIAAGERVAAPSTRSFPDASLNRRPQVGEQPPGDSSTCSRSCGLDPDRGRDPHRDAGRFLARSTPNRDALSPLS